MFLINSSFDDESVGYSATGSCSIIIILCWPSSSTWYFILISCYPMVERKKRRLRSKSNDPGYPTDLFVLRGKGQAFLSAWIPFPSQKILNILDVGRAKLRNSKDKKVEGNGDFKRSLSKGFPLERVPRVPIDIHLSLKIFRVFHFAIQNFGWNKFQIYYRAVEFIQQKFRIFYHSNGLLSSNCWNFTLRFQLDWIRFISDRFSILSKVSIRIDVYLTLKIFFLNFELT